MILSVAMTAGAFLFMGLRLRQGRRIRPAAYQLTMTLLLVSVVVLVREAARLFGADWDASGTALLGVSGLFVYTGGSLLQPAARNALVQDDPPRLTGDLRAEVDALVRELEQEARCPPAPPPPPRRTWEICRDAIVRPAQAYRELRVHPHLELCGIVPLLVLFWPRLTLFAAPDETVGFLVLGAIDYGLWILLYDLGKAAMFWGIARARGRIISYASAVAAFMLIDIPSLTDYLLCYLWPGQYVFEGAFVYSRLGLGPLFAHLASSHPILFDVVAKMDLVHVWTFLLWWVAVAVLMEMRARVALLVTIVTFPAAHVFSFTAVIFLYFVTGGEPSPFFGG